MDERSADALKRRGMISWVVFDLANVLFAINIISLYFPLWIVDDAGGSDANYAIASGISMAAVFFTAPLVGTLTDRLPRRLPVLIGFTLACCMATAFLGTGGLVFSLVLFVVANTMFQLCLLVYDSLLPTVSTVETRGRISGYGIAAGFAGSVLGIAIGMIVLAFDETAKPMVFRLTAVLFAIGAIPCFLFVREQRRADPEKLDRSMLRQTVNDVRASVRDARGCPGLVRFLVGRVFYIDATNTLLIFMSIYATEEIGFSDFQTQMVLLAGILAGPIGALKCGASVDRYGPKRTLNRMLSVWIVALSATALIPMLGLPSALFWIVAPLVGIGLGGTSTTERAYLFRLAPPQQVGRYLGLYALLGRFASIVSPLLWVFIADILGLGRPVAVTSLIVMVIIARQILSKVDDSPTVLIVQETPLTAGLLR